MSIYPSPDKLDSLPSKYALVILAAKRARQVKDGAKRLTDSRSANPLTVALEEIAAGAIISRVVEDATVTAYESALKPTEPSMEDIIAAGPMIALDSEQDFAAQQLAAFRSAEPDSEEDDLLGGDDNEREVRPVDGFALDSAGLLNALDDDEDDLMQGIEEDEE